MILTLAGLLSVWLYALLVPTIIQEGGVVYYLRPATSKQLLIKELSEKKILRYPMAFAWFIYPQFSTQLKTGEYLFPKGASALTIWQQLIRGHGLYMRNFIIVPGSTFQQIRQGLLQTETFKHATQTMSDKEIMSYLGQAELMPEGEFFPETYYYTRGVNDLVILKRAFELMQKRLQVAWLNRAPNLPYKTSYQALIAASLIEREAYLNIERPMIAGVLINRLRANMLLQFDPTVIYGMGNRYQGKIHKQDLQADTVYNTYLHMGLPPTPIAMPSLASIEAALHPQLNDYYYFVARGDGSHQFSKTLTEHNAAVAAMLKKSKNTPIVEPNLNGTR